MIKKETNGGIARALALSPEQRKEIASAAAAARWGIPKATHDGEIMIGTIAIPCAVLEDGTRVLTQAGLLQALGRSGRPHGGAYSTGVEQLPAFLRSQSLKPFISEEISSSSRPIDFVKKTGGKALGFRAELLPMICDVFLEARKSGNLPPNQHATAQACEMMVRSLAKVGIIALVDEATGYQEIRDKHALQAILDKYLAKELAAWAKRFPDEFYQQIFRLRGWEWKGMKVNRPQVVAHYTKDIVYERLAPGILEELERRNPKDDGSRKAKHHQWLTVDVGHPALAQHLYAVLGLMRISLKWDDFKNHLDRAYPKKGQTLMLL